MSDILRWHLGGLPGTTGIVEVMLYADHVAAVAAARAEEALSREFFHAEGYAQGQRDERERIVTYLRDNKQMPSSEAQAWAYGFAEVVETGAFNGAAREEKP